MSDGPILEVPKIKRTPAERLMLVMELLGGKETCPTCGTVVEKPALISLEDAKELLKVDMV